MESNQNHLICFVLFTENCYEDALQCGGKEQKRSKH